MRLCYELGLEDFAAATLKDTVRLLCQSVQTVTGKKGKEEDVDCAMMLNSITIYSFVYNCSIQKLKGFFNDPTSFNIAIDMLFTKGQYEGEFHLSIVILLFYILVFQQVLMFVCYILYEKVRTNKV